MKLKKDFMHFKRLFKKNYKFKIIQFSEKLILKIIKVLSVLSHLIPILKLFKDSKLTFIKRVF